MDGLVLANTPSCLSYFMPPQWHEHQATLMAWPFLTLNQEWMEPIDKVRSEYQELLLSVANDEKVILLHRPIDLKSIPSAISSHSNVNFLEVDLNDVWTRDFAPIFLKSANSKEASSLPVIWNFTGWGGKFSAELDGQAWKKIFLELKVREYFQGPLSLEGGAVEVDGEGFALTTSSCLLSSTRNSNLCKEDVAKIIKNYFGVHTVHFLESGFIGNDHTDGHIDMVARFTPTNNILANSVADSSHPSYKSFLNNYRSLLALAARKGGKVIKLPIPTRKVIGLGWEGKQVEAPLSYANFYCTTKSVLVPQFNDPHDNLALEIIQANFPKHKAKGLKAVSIVKGGGGIFNCLTQQVP